MTRGTTPSTAAPEHAAPELANPELEAPESSPGNPPDPGASEGSGLERSGSEGSGCEGGDSEASAGGDSPRVRRWLERLDRSRWALGLLFLASFLETIIVPIPIELILIPYLVTHRDRLWRTASTVTAGCLAASLLGYGIGYYLFETLGRWAIGTFGWDGAHQRFQELFEAHGFLAIVAVGIAPIPFQIAMLAAGAVGYSIALFVLAATIARGLRYFGLAGLVRWKGEEARELWRTRRWAAILALLALLAALWGLSQGVGAMLG